MKYMIEFWSGFGMALFVASAVFFMKFWRASRDSFYMYFGYACLLMGVERAVLLVSGILNEQLREEGRIAESNAWIYTIRLMAFALLLIAIVKRNRRTE